MKNLLIQCTLDRASRKKDRSVSLSFITDLEQTSKEFMDIDEAINNKGILYFKSEGDLTQGELDSIDEVDIENTGKTKSQKLRAVIWLLSKQKGLDPKEFYSDKMEEIIEHIKNKLD